MAKGEFIAVQDSDDLSHHERFEKQIAYLTNNPDTDLIGTNYVAFENNRLDQIIGSGKGWIRYGDNIPKMYAKGGHCICHGTILFRGSLFDRIGGHTRRVSGAEDYEFIVKCINSKSKIENLPDPLYYYRNHPQQRSRRYFSLEWNEESDE
ncbi:hypothetical protein GCM10025859_66720 [Alicyclobacillus fastidiosus]|nr:hypothetical protein GCM10025859_66720 [Alicyclobacillus fastidiosus]